MRKIIFVAAALVAAGTGSAVATDVESTMRTAQGEYKAAMEKADSDYDRAAAQCAKLDKDGQAECNRKAREAQRKAKSDANADYARAAPKMNTYGGA